MANGGSWGRGKARPPQILALPRGLRESAAESLDANAFRGRLAINVIPRLPLFWRATQIRLPGTGSVWWPAEERASIRAFTAARFSQLVLFLFFFYIRYHKHCSFALFTSRKRRAVNLEK